MLLERRSSSTSCSLAISLLSSSSFKLLVSDLLQGEHLKGTSSDWFDSKPHSSSVTRKKGKVMLCKLLCTVLQMV